MKDPIERQAAIQPEQQHGRVFKGVVVEYPPYNIWKPYFSIKYTENGQEFIGYGTYKPEVLSEYLKEYFMPSAQPDTDEWCHDCKEYDKDHHCCPRWNRVIKTTLAEAQQVRTEMSSANWIPCSERLPEDYEEVLVWFEYFRYGVYNRLYQTHGIGDYSSEYDSWMINHETGWHKLRVIAWMPLPEPYKGGEQDG